MICLSGPYFTYRTYCDMFLYAKNELRFCFKETLKTLAYVPFFISLFLVTSWMFPLEVRDTIFFARLILSFTNSFYIHFSSIFTRTVSIVKLRFSFDYGICIRHSLFFACECTSHSNYPRQSV